MASPQVRHEAWHNPHWPCPDCQKMGNLTRWAPSLVAEGHADFYHCFHCGADWQVAREFDVDGGIEVSK